MPAKKSLGQNFLRNPEVARKIALSGHLSPGETVVEIGPGKGILTKELLATGARVVAIEKDERLAADLQTLQLSGLEIVVGDALLLLESVSLGLGKYKIVANIPYYITGALFKKIFSLQNLPSKVVLMVQKEIASRILDKEKESLLSLSTKLYSTPKLDFNVGRGNFSPVPKVDSAVISLSEISRDKISLFSTRLNLAENKGEKLFFSFIKSGFAQKRKKLSSNLENLCGKAKAETALVEIGKNASTRAEDLKLEDWFTLIQTVA